MAQVARISVQYWAPIQLELSSTYCSTSGTARAARKNGISTRALVSARFQPAGPEYQSCRREAVDSAASACAGCALMPDPLRVARRGLGVGRGARGSEPKGRRRTETGG